MRPISFACFSFAVLSTLVAPAACAGDVAYTISTAAGSGEAGFSGDGGPATKAQLNRPCGVAVGPEGELFIADYSNQRIRKVARDGTIGTLAGCGEAGFAGDGGPATRAKLWGPYGVRVDKRGNVYIADQRNNRIRKVSPDGTISTVAGNGKSEFSGDGGPATAAGLSGPNDMIVDADGNLIIADSGNHRVRKVTADGTITTIAGSGKVRYNGGSGYGGDGGPAVKARLNLPSAPAFDSAGTLYIGDFRNHAVRKMTADGVITTVVGNGKIGFDDDGLPATRTRANELGGITFDSTGCLVYTDGVNFRVRRVGPDGLVQTIAGTGERAYGGDGGPAVQAKLSVLDAVASGPDNTLYVVDHSNSRIRKLTPAAGPAPVEKDTDALLRRMRRAYDNLRAAKVSFTFRRRTDREQVAPAGNLVFAAPANVRAEMDFPNYGSVKVYCDGRTVTTCDPTEDEPDVIDYSPDGLQRMLPGNLELLCLYDWRRQLSTSPGGNMRDSQLRIVNGESWNHRQWTVLEETAGRLLVRYFVDPQTNLIWRTQVRDATNQETTYDGWLTGLDPIDAVDQRQFEMPTKK